MTTSSSAEAAAARIQAAVRGMHVRQHVFPAIEEAAWINAETIKILMSRVAELETTCRQQQTRLAMQADKIAVLDQIFKARMTKSASATRSNEEEVKFETYALPALGAPEE